jgi:hypothetical protein
MFDSTTEGEAKIDVHITASSHGKTMALIAESCLKCRR